VNEHRLATSRTQPELRANAAELHRMAATARTEDVRDALIRLAGRFDRLAAGLVAEEDGGGVP
jgi:hypothetical protein